MFLRKGLVGLLGLVGLGVGLACGHAVAGDDIHPEMVNAHILEGQSVFNTKCARCHDDGQAASSEKKGPSLMGVVGRPAAAAEGFSYSSRMKALNAAGMIWTKKSLKVMLGRIDAFLPETLMEAHGLSETEIHRVVDYLDTRHVPGSQLVEGERLVTGNCVQCHDISPEQKIQTGPPLWGVYGRRAGSVPGFEYSPTLSKYRDMELTWDVESLRTMLIRLNTAYLPLESAMAESLRQHAHKMTDYQIDLVIKYLASLRTKGALLAPSVQETK